MGITHVTVKVSPLVQDNGSFENEFWLIVNYNITICSRNNLALDSLAGGNF